VKLSNYNRPAGSVCRVPRWDSSEPPIALGELKPGWYLVDNRAFSGRGRERVIPKCVPTISDGVVLCKDGRLRVL